MPNQYTTATDPTPAERFWSKVEFTDSCWLWQGKINREGYGRFWNGSRQMYAHRWAYEFCVGPIPEGLELDHHCDNPPCARPDHLEPVTHRVNMLRGNNFAARNARMTHCWRGHPFNDENTYLWRGSRHCRACWKIRQAEARSGQAVLL